MTEFEDVYRRYFGDVYHYALALTRDEHTAEEITQETFFKALRSIDQFDGRCKISVWLCQIAKNTYFTQYQRALKAQQLWPEPQERGSMEETLENRETAFQIHTDKETVGDALLELGLIAGEEGAYGLYVKTVNGLTVDYDTDGKYWAFYTNGEYAVSGVDTTTIEAGITYSFKVE